jgi:uncharacterized membrane protein (DUF485 family)
MSEPRVAGGSVAAGSVAQGEPQIDWEAAVETPEFKELVSRRRRFVIPATVFFMAWFFGFILLCGYAENFMGREFIADGMTVGYALALSQFVMVWVFCWLYLRIADRTFDPLAQRAAQRAVEISTLQRTPASEPALGAPASTSEEVTDR